MKQKFLEIIEEIKQTGFKERLSEIEEEEEFERVWGEFALQNDELFTKVENWVEEFKQTGSKPIFEKGVEDIVICFCIIAGMWETAEKNFEEPSDFVNALWEELGIDFESFFD